MRQNDWVGMQKAGHCEGRNHAGQFLGRTSVNKVLECAKRFLVKSEKGRQCWGSKLCGSVRAIMDAKSMSDFVRETMQHMFFRLACH
jgi:hypothetical protein